MERISHTVRKFSLLAAGFLMLSLSSKAADVIVEPGMNTLVDAVNENPGSTFILERGKLYLTDVDIAIDDPTVIMAADGDKALSPPVIQYFANPGETGGKKPFMLGASTTFKGIGFFGYASGDEQQLDKYFTVTASDIDITFDGCVFQAINHILEFSNKNNNTYTFKNNVFYNIFNARGDSSGGYGMPGGGDGCAYKAENNTYFMVGRIFNGGGMVGTSSETMNHNTYVNTWGELFYPSSSQDYIATNNIHYNAQIRGYVGKRFDADGEVIWEGDFCDWEYDTLVGDIAIFPHACDSLDNDGQRIVRITNNIKMYDQTVMDFYTENVITPMTLWNVHGRELYGPRYGWEYKNNYLQEDNNAIDPKFEKDIPADSYRAMFLNRQNRHLPTAQQDEDYPYQMVYLPEDKTIMDFIWPLPFDFTPTNSAIYHLGSDGYPIGDLNWFPPEVIASFQPGPVNPLWGVEVRDYKLNDLNLKSYPNPFNSLTKISYDLPGDGIVTVSIFSVSGAQVAQVVNEYQGHGQHEVVFDGSNLSVGIYFCKVQMGHFSQFGKMSIVR